MKYLISSLRLGTLSLVFMLISCQSESLQDDMNNTISTKKEISSSLTAKKVIFYASWDEWGRSSKNCAGWGLCNFYSCWFCEPKGKYSGKVEVDDVTKDGTLFIELNPTESIQNTAITEQSPFYIDNDIINENAILHKGEYQFDNTIGEYGGYKVNITMQ